MESFRGGNMADRAKLQEEIKCQGEIVRKLKAEKAEKDKVGINLLEKLLSSIQTKMGLIFYELVCESDHMFAIHVDPRHRFDSSPEVI